MGHLNQQSQQNNFVNHNVLWIFYKFEVFKKTTQKTAIFGKDITTIIIGRT